MRRDRGPKGLFEYRDQWIGQEPGRPGYYRYWYDDGSRRVKRKALLAIDLSGAKEELIDILASAGISSKDPSQVYLIDALAHYLEHYATPAGYKQMAAARRAGQLIMTAMHSLLPNPRVSDLTLIRQQLCWSYLSTKHELGSKSISTYMISVRAAINYCARPHIIKVGTEKKETQMLDSTVAVICNEDEIAAHIGKIVSGPREYIPTFAEFGKWIDAIVEEDDFRYVMIALNTAARNEAIFDLRVSEQVNYEFGIIDLNPGGRRQTKKRRPILRMTTNLAAWLAHWNDDRPVKGFQDIVEKRINKIGKDEKLKLGMPDMTCYTIRHFMGTQLRRSTSPVSREQRSKWMGHTVKEGSKTTEWYEKFDPDYLESPMRATEEIIRKLQKHTRRKLFAPAARSQGKVRIIEGGKI
jgi:integrase